MAIFGAKVTVITNTVRLQKVQRKAFMINDDSFPKKMISGKVLLEEISAKFKIIQYATACHTQHQ